MKKLLNWFDDHLLFIFSIFLIAFIPLYPKLPLMELIPGYIVRVRVEDFLILTGFLIFLIQVLRKKADYKSAIFWPMVIYIVIGLLSSLSAIFITKTVPQNIWHVSKVFLHWFRRIEYFSIFFIFYNGVRRFKDAKKIIFLSFLAVFAVSVYGYGQKYLYWPVYSTMNREFSKGVKLYLTEHARVPSTFGGHYDLAAYLVIFLPLLLSASLLLKNKALKAFTLLTFLMGYWLMILTASRTSFLAYLAALAVLFLILIFKKGFWWSSIRGTVVFVFTIWVMVFFGDLSDRFAHFLKMPEIKDKLKLDKLLKPLKPAPANFVALDHDIQLVMDSTDERPTQEKPVSSSVLPPDVYEDIPNGFQEVTASGQLATSSANATDSATVMVPVQRTFSDNAYKYGLSTAIRLDALWPRAIAGFKKNPLLGSGYSTLTKESVGQFTEAESTDNDYLRVLGETGLLGFLSFFAIFFVVLKKGFQGLRKEQNPLFTAFLASFIAFTIGLLINALYIDVFEASKVAFIFWALTGLMLAVLEKTKVKTKGLNE